MADKKQVLGVCAAIGFGLVACNTSVADDKKRAEGDDFTEKLEKRFPEEAKRGENSIFRKIKGPDKPQVVNKKADESADAPERAESAGGEERVMDTKPKSGGLGGLFKKLKGGDESETVVATEIDDEDKKSSNKSELPPVTKLPAATVTKDGVKQFASWDDVPYKRQDTVDKMLDRLQVKTPAKPKTVPRLPLPGPRPVSPPTAAEPKPAKEAKKAPVISDN